jgi:cysteinyl-tRNA synthetase
MRLFNSLSRKVEEFEPINPPDVGMYTCGPTVYDYVSIGNWRTYLLGDILFRSLRYFGYKVKYIMNITDVGHLTGDNLGDADLGEDRMEEAAEREKKSAWDVAEYYTEDFFQGFTKLNLLKPKRFSKATDHIKEQIELVSAIEENGFSYKTSDGIYFDTKKYELAGNKYGELSTLDKIKAGVRVEVNPEKRDKRDFALWKFSPQGKLRDMEWDSPWFPKGMKGDKKGFPGWHIECSAMSMKYLGEQFDVHVGGEDLLSTHHPNEVAQAEAVSGKKPFVKYWVHGAFLLVDGGRMGKSLGNAYTLHEVEKRGYSPMHLRYFYLTGHYRKQLNFTWKGLDSAATSFNKLTDAIANFKHKKQRSVLSRDKLGNVDRFQDEFKKALSTNLNTAKGLSIVWEVVKSNIPGYDKYELLMDFDQVLGLRLKETKGAGEEVEIPEEIRNLLDEREKLRKQRRFETADRLRIEIEGEGYKLEDTKKGTTIKKKR